jgi:high-affinity iron transporter
MMWLAAMLLAVAIGWGAASPASADGQWQDTTDAVVALLEGVPAQHAAGDVKAAEAAIRKAYYEEYQASGLEDEIKHRLGAERSMAFQQGVVDLRNLAREGTEAEVEAKTAELIELLRADVAEAATAPEVDDRWSRVAANIVDAAGNALRLYEQGNAEKGLKEATRAYLQHYEADGLEKATLSYLSNGRMAKVERAFRDIRVGIRDGAPVDEVRGHVEALGQMVTEDAAALDALGASESVGWSGFVAAFLILLREGVEALLVVAAVVTYVIKTGRRDQLRGVYLGIGAAVLVSIGLAVAFNSMTSSGALGLTQELIEGVVVFLAVAREGFETILFFVPVFGAAQTPGDHLLIWLGIGVAVLVLAGLFVAVRYFGVRLPLKPFFRWMAVLLSLLAVVMAGGAAKELQDALVLESTPIDGLPQIEWLGIYPTVETLVAQGIVAAVVVALGLWQRAKAKANTPELSDSHAHS